MNILNQPYAEQIDELISVQRDIADKLSPAYKLKNWEDVQAVLRRGKIDNYLSIGDQLMANYNGVPHVWDIIGIDKDTPTDRNFTHSLTIMSRDVLRYSCRFDAPQAMYNAETGLAPDTYIFTTNGVQYEITTMVAIPEGGVLYIATRDEYVPLTLTSYQANRKDVIEENITVTQTTGTDTLTPINDHVRCRYGSNRYIHSAYRQWLNSNEATFAWQPKGLYDMPSTYETQGFLDLLDPELVSVLGAVDKQVARNTVTDGGGQDTFSEKVFPLSRVEMGYGTEGDTTGEFVYPFWENATDADKIKLEGSTPRYWWLRSPNVSYSNLVRSVTTSGTLSYHFAIDSLGLAHACVIV